MGKTKRISLVASNSKKNIYIIKLKLSENEIKKTNPNIESQVLVKFIGEMTHSIISISKIKPYEQFKKEYSNTKKLKLINAIQIADKIFKGEMTYEQHYYLCQKGIDSCQKQTLYILEKMKKEKKNMKNNKENNYLGNKRNNCNNISNNFINGRDLQIQIEDFIYYKKGIPIEEYKDIFNKMKLMIENNKINNNLMQSLIKLLRFLHNTRNFNEEIISMDFFIEFQNIIKNKILLTLFETNNLNLEEKNIEKVNIEELEKQIDNYNLELEQSSLSMSSTKKNKNKIETNEESIISYSGSKYDDNKSKVVITPLDQLSIFELLNSFENENNLNLNIKESINKDDIIKQMKNLSQIKSNNDNQIKDYYLRRTICLKLYNVFEVLFKNMNVSKSDIKNLCMGLECKARNCDNEMSSTYKNHINHIFKLIKQYFI